MKLAISLDESDQYHVALYSQAAPLPSLSRAELLQPFSAIQPVGTMYVGFVRCSTDACELGPRDESFERTNLFTDSLAWRTSVPQTRVGQSLLLSSLYCLAHNTQVSAHLLRFPSRVPLVLLVLYCLFVSLPWMGSCASTWAISGFCCATFTRQSTRWIC